MSITDEWVNGASWTAIIAALQTTEDKAVAAETKLAGIASGATANQTDAHLLSRGNHTGTQSITTITDGGGFVRMTDADRLKLNGIETRASYDRPEITLARAGQPDLATRLASDKATAQRQLNDLFALARRPSYDAVRLATTADISLVELPIIDGVQTVVGDRVLVKDQDDASENGIYIVGASTWSRASDMNEAAEFTPRKLIPVNEGSTNAQRVYELSVTLPITVGTSTITFARVAALADAFVSGTAAEINATTPAIGTVFLKTDTDQFGFGDGSTAGGVELAAKKDLAQSVRDHDALLALPSNAVAAGDVVQVTRGRGAGRWVATMASIATLVAADALGGVYVPFADDATGASGGFVRDHQGEVNVRWFGAAMDNTTNDYAALRAARDVAVAAGISTLNLTRGKMYVSTTAAQTIPIGSGLTIKGAGRHATRIRWEGDSGGAANNLFSTESGVSYTDVTLRDFRITGPHTPSSTSQVSQYPILLRSIEDLTIERVGIRGSRVMAMAIRDSSNVTIHRCHVTRCARDGINTTACNGVQITNNIVSHIDDDAIANHSEYQGAAESQILIANNRIRFAQGIRCIGAKNASILNNNIAFFVAFGIWLRSGETTSAPFEGISAEVGNSIVGNTIANGVERTLLDGLNAGCRYIFVDGPASQVGTGDAAVAVLPGLNDTATGTIVNPYPYFHNLSDADETQPVAINTALLIADNMLIRDAAAGRAVSEYGYGIYYVRGGEYDPSPTDAQWRQQGIVFAGGVMRGALVSGNVIHGIGNAVEVGSSTQLIGSRIVGNKVIDCSNGVVLNSGEQQLLIDDNVFDLDPYFLSARRTAVDGAFTGAWDSLGSPTGIAVNSATGVLARRNTFRNMSRVTDANVSGAPSVVAIAFEANLLECDPGADAFGYDASHKGIGAIPRPGPGFRFRIVDSDPSSANYGKVLNNCSLFAEAMPASGKWIKGQRVQDSTYAAGVNVYPYTRIGWRRATFGSNNVLGTDWIEERVDSGLYARRGTTAQRPTLTAAHAGFLYDDGDLGRAIRWNGSAWTEIDGGDISTVRMGRYTLSLSDDTVGSIPITTLTPFMFVSNANNANALLMVNGDGSIRFMTTATSIRDQGINVAMTGTTGLDSGVNLSFNTSTLTLSIENRLNGTGQFAIYPFPRV